MARLEPNLNVIKMTGFAVGLTYFGAFALAHNWGITTEELTKQYSIQFYVAMALMIIIFLQGEVQDQKAVREEKEEQQRQEEALKRKEEEKKQRLREQTEITNKKKRRGRNRRSKK